MPQLVKMGVLNEKMCKTNKCKTNKCKTSKCKTNKCKTNKCKTNKCKTNKCKTKKVNSKNLAKRGKTRHINSRVKNSPFYKKKMMKGGNYNEEHIKCLRKILITYRFDETNIDTILNIFNITSQIYPIEQLLNQMVDDRFVISYSHLERCEINLSGITEAEKTEGFNDVNRLLVLHLQKISEMQEGDTDNESENESENESDSESDSESENESDSEFEM